MAVAENNVKLKIGGGEMLMKLKKSQSTAEYAILISLIVAAALGMQLYMKRSLQAKMHDASLALTDVTGDVTGDGVLLANSRQYEPYYSSQKVSAINRTSTATNTADELEGGAFSRTSEQAIGAQSTGTDQTYSSVLDE